MIEVLAKELEVDDIFYYQDTYRIVVSDRRYTNAVGFTFVEVKCIVGPTPTKEDLTDIDYGTVSYLAGRVTVKLLVRNGKEV